MPLEKIKPTFSIYTPGTESELNLVHHKAGIAIEKINEIIELLNKIFTPGEIKFQSSTICTFGRCDCAHCKLLLKEYGNILEKYNSLLEDKKKCQ